MERAEEAKPISRSSTYLVQMQNNNAKKEDSFENSNPVFILDSSISHHQNNGPFDLSN